MSAVNGPNNPTSSVDVLDNPTSAVDGPDNLTYAVDGPDNPTFAAVGLPTNAGVDFVARLINMSKSINKYI